MKTDKIYLVGFMAAGKTTLAQALARRLGWRAEDVDALIEARERRTVAEIFARDGEPYFRSVERQVIWSLLPQRHTVVATGGGTFIDPENRAAINADGVSVWIDVPFEVLLNRIPADGRRPLANDRVQMALLYESRRLAYQQAQVRLDASPRARRRAGRTTHRAARIAMRYLVLSDIHSNLEALDAVLRAAAAQKYDAVLVLGDLVGYGADPERRRRADARRSSRSRSCAATTTRWRQGSMTRTISTRWRESAAHWTREALTPATLDYLRDLPSGPSIVDEKIEICHGSPLDEDLYVVADLDAARSIAVRDAPLCLFGHTHVALSGEMDGATTARDRNAAGPAGIRDRPRRRCEISRQPRLGRPASRRRCASGIRDRRHGREDRHAAPRGVPD